MYTTTKPSQQAVREYMGRLRNDHVPLDPEQARRELGWGLVIPSSDPESKKINYQER